MTDIVVAPAAVPAAKMAPEKGKANTTRSRILWGVLTFSLGAITMLASYRAIFPPNQGGGGEMDHVMGAFMGGRIRFDVSGHWNGTFNGTCNSTMIYLGEAMTAEGRAWTNAPNYTAGSIVYLQNPSHWDLVPWLYWLLGYPSFYTMSAEGGVTVGVAGSYNIDVTLAGATMIDRALPTAGFGVAVHKHIGGSVSEFLEVKPVSDQLGVMAGTNIGFSRQLDAGDTLVIKIVTIQQAGDFWEQEPSNQVLPPSGVVVKFYPLLSYDELYVNTPQIATIRLTRRYPLLFL